jgi:hypothetical protein
MPIKLMLFCFLLASNIFADSGEKILNGYDPKVDIISDDYEAGPYLIYDCLAQHWTCVLETYYKDCQKKREEDLHFKAENMRCSPVAQFPNKKSCFQKQLFMVSQNFGNRFCIGPTWQEKEIKF